jgi:membrane fusion protein (multidrug efflux system)
MGIRAIFPNPDKAVRPGMYVNITCVLGKRELLSVPEAAVMDRAGGKAVFTVDASNLLVAVPVEIGALRDGQRIILKGLAPGQKIVVEGLVQAQPGMRVEVVAPAEAKPASQGNAPK